MCAIVVIIRQEKKKGRARWGGDDGRRAKPSTVDNLQVVRRCSQCKYPVGHHTTPIENIQSKFGNLYARSNIYTKPGFRKSSQKNKSCFERTRCCYPIQYTASPRQNTPSAMRYQCSHRTAVCPTAALLQTCRQTVFERGGAELVVSQLKSRLSRFVLHLNPAPTAGPTSAAEKSEQRSACELREVVTAGAELGPAGYTERTEGDRQTRSDNDFFLFLSLSKPLIFFLVPKTPVQIPQKKIKITPRG